ncbi:MAG TPA: methyltransferase [Terracidiphilus sp.]|jgi:SAM-dependent methyltransferase|nr:methyltransferase [Terracidiphilus sp.]
MLVDLSQEEFRRLLAFFAEAGYVEATIRKHLGPAELPSRQLRNESRLLDRTSEPTQLNALLRWFWLGRPQTDAQVADSVPAEFLGLLLKCGLLKTNAGSLQGTAMLLPADGFLVAADYPVAIERAKQEMVLWPNPTSRFLAKFSIRRHSRATLDLGTGSGILSLIAAKFSDKVVATDLNERAVSFARFNAKLNGVDNIEVVAGDCFAPVKDCTFDLILSNPPFFITPQQGYMFCDNPMELDGLCRRLVKEAPAYLNEGGFMQMLCEWAQVSGQPWEERLSEWLVGTGCDAWVIKGATENPAEYAQHRIRETSQDPADDARLYDEYMTYYRERGVEAINEGLVVMRRRTGTNWVQLEEVTKTPQEDLGELVLSTFAARDLLLQLKDDDSLLAVKPTLSANARLEQICTQSRGQWVAESITLRLISGFPFHLALQPPVAEFLATCDGTRTADQAIQELAAVANAPLETVRRECLAMMRKLIERGFMIVAPG